MALDGFGGLWVGRWASHLLPPNGLRRSPSCGQGVRGHASRSVWIILSQSLSRLARMPGAVSRFANESHIWVVSAALSTWRQRPRSGQDPQSGRSASAERESECNDGCLQQVRRLRSAAVPGGFGGVRTVWRDRISLATCPKRLACPVPGGADPSVRSERPLSGVRRVRSLRPSRREQSMFPLRWLGRRTRRTRRGSTGVRACVALTALPEIREGNSSRSRLSPPALSCTSRCWPGPSRSRCLCELLCNTMLATHRSTGGGALSSQCTALLRCPQNSASGVNGFLNTLGRSWVSSLLSALCGHRPHGGGAYADGAHLGARGRTRASRASSSKIERIRDRERDREVSHGTRAWARQRHGPSHPTTVVRVCGSDRRGHIAVTYRKLRDGPPCYGWNVHGEWNAGRADRWEPTLWARSESDRSASPTDGGIPGYARRGMFGHRSDHCSVMEQTAAGHSEERIAHLSYVAGALSGGSWAYPALGGVTDGGAAGGVASAVGIRQSHPHASLQLVEHGCRRTSAQPASVSWRGRPAV